MVIEEGFHRKISMLLDSKCMIELWLWKPRSSSHGSIMHSAFSQLLQSSHTLCLFTLLAQRHASATNDWEHSHPLWWSALRDWVWCKSTPTSVMTWNHSNLPTSTINLYDWRKHLLLTDLQNRGTSRPRVQSPSLLSLYPWLCNQLQLMHKL